MTINKHLWAFSLIISGLITVAAMEVTGLRSITPTTIAPGDSFQVSIRLRARSGLTTDEFILVEYWPDGYKIESAYFNDVATPIIQVNNEYRWIFGYGEENPPATSGTLTYRIWVPEDAASKSHTVTGTLYQGSDKAKVSGDNSITVAPTTEDEAPYLALNVTPGWNFLALPFSLDPYSTDVMQNNFDGLYNFTATTQSFHAGTIQSTTAGAPFWCYYSGKNQTTLALTGVVSGEPSLTTASGKWSPGWNLTSVNSLSPIQRPESDVPIWFWQEYEYRQYSGDELLPGQAYWIFQAN